MLSETLTTLHTIFSTMNSNATMVLSLAVSKWITTKTYLAVEQLFQLIQEHHHATKQNA